MTMQIDDAAAEPGAIPGNIARAAGSGEGWFGHPPQLKRLFTTEMWERFGYYGMRAILTLYLAKHFLFKDTTSTAIYGGFTALVYLTPLIGGLIADRQLGSKRSVKFGAILMALGYFTLCFGGDAAKPYAEIDGQRYEVTIAKHDKVETRSIVLGSQTLVIKGNDDKSVSLLGADGKEVRKIAKDGFKSDGERSPLFVAILLLGLAAVTIGNGFFKPNISTIVGSLYADGDRRRDAGFTIFYMGINLGSLISQFFCPILADSVGWWAGFGLAAIGMSCSWMLFQFDGGRLEGYGDRPAGASASKDWMVYGGALLAIPLVWFLFNNLMGYVSPKGGVGLIGYVEGLPIMGRIMFSTFPISVIGILIWSWFYGDRKEFQMMLAAMLMIVFNTVFWTLFEQAGSSLTLFAERNTVLEIGWTGPLFAMFRAAPASYYVFFIAVFGGVSSLAYWFFSNGEGPAVKRTMRNAFSVIAVLGVIGMHIARLRGFGGEAVYVMPAGQTQIFNALFIVALAPIFSMMWNAMARRGIEPPIPVKFGIALMGVGLGFLLLVWGSRFADSEFKVGMVWLAGLYLIHSIAELCISPVGLSMITKLSIPRIVGMMMGVWFLSIAVAQYVAGIVAGNASVETVGGQVTNMKVSLDTYVGVFTTISLWAIGLGAALLVLSWPLKRLMHGVK
jgi:POT family proton-dependent oligopeptide transporter